jgi:hypothetical protein
MLSSLCPPSDKEGNVSLWQESVILCESLLIFLSTQAGTFFANFVIDVISAARLARDDPIVECEAELVNSILLIILAISSSSTLIIDLEDLLNSSIIS